MYKNKKDVDKHVENLISKLSVKEFKIRACSVARLYYDVGDFANCQKYVEQYITQKDNNAAAFKLLGQALQKLGQKEKALEQYKIALDIDPTQTSVVLDICELLADEDLTTVDPGQAKYWCEKAEATFPRHPVTFRLRERLVTISNPDPEALVNLLTGELAVRPKDLLLHIRLIKHYMQINKFRDAFEHSCNIEFIHNSFVNNFTWYETIVELLKSNNYKANDWLYQLFLLTVKERICMLSLTEAPVSISKSIIESTEFLHDYDQAIETVAKAGPSPGFVEFHAVLLQHHRGQFAFYAATLLLKKAKKSQLNWKDAVKLAAPLMLIAWHTTPLGPKVHWLKHAQEKQVNAVTRWYSEGSYRCSQSGHYLLTNAHDKSQTMFDQISQCCSGSHWRDKLYEKIFPSRSHLTRIKTSDFTSHTYTGPVLRLPRRQDIEVYDSEAQREFGSSLHHFVWTLLNYKNLAQFKCTLFDMLTPNITDCSSETLNKMDIQAFLFCAALTCKQQKSMEVSFYDSDKPIILPASITDVLCPLSQLKWWDCAYKYSQNGPGMELTDIRATLTRGIEVVRCIDNHGLDVELLCTLGRIFNERSIVMTNTTEKNHLEMRAMLYYSSAIPFLEKLKSKMLIKIPDKRMFDYTHKDLDSKEINSLIDESKLYVAKRYYNDSEYDKVVELLSQLKSPQAIFYLSQTYKKLALEEHDLSKDVTPQTKSKYATLITKAKNYAYKALERLKETETTKANPLYSEVQELIENIETYINKMEQDISSSDSNEVDSKYPSYDNISTSHMPLKTNRHIFRNLSSTPKAPQRVNNTSYQSAIDTLALESSHVDQHFYQRIENEIKTLHNRDTAVNDFMIQTKNWFDENNKLGNQIMSTIHTNIQNTTDQFKLLKISIDHVKDQIDECRNECKDVGEIKKQVSLLKKEVDKLKENSEELSSGQNNLYNVDNSYRVNDTTSTFPSQLPFAPAQVLPHFNPRLVNPFPVPPNPYQIYGQTLQNLYSHYSQYPQPSSTPGVPRTPVNYPNVYPTPDQIYLDMAHLIPPNVPTTATGPSVPVLPTVPSVPIIPVISVPPVTAVITSKANTKDIETARSLPVNVVITSSDPLPTSTLTPAPVLSVTIPPKHIKGTPHNYQIAMPSINESKGVAPPVFTFPFDANKTITTTPNSSSSIRKSYSMKTNFKSDSYTETSTEVNDDSVNKTLDRPIVNQNCAQSSPNTSINKSRTLSEKSNTSVENYDPCPDFKPIVPLPAEVIVKTGEEEETVIFCARAKLFRFVDKQWKERGLGTMKLLKHKLTGKVRVLMRREQILKVCANHIISSEMEIKPMINEAKAYFWVAHDFADENMVFEKLCIRFKTDDIALEFYNCFEKARQEASTTLNDVINSVNIPTGKPEIQKMYPNVTSQKDHGQQVISTSPSKAVVGGFTFSTKPNFKTLPSNNEMHSKPAEQIYTKSNIFDGLALKTTLSSPFSNLFNVPASTMASATSTLDKEVPRKLNVSDTVDEYEPSVDFKPIIPLPALVDTKTGEEDEIILFEHRAKLLRYVPTNMEWKERGLGNIKLLVHKDNINKVRLLMRREQIMKVCCNHAVTKEMIFQKMPNMDKAVTWCAKDFSEGELISEVFCLRFKTVQLCDNFIEAIKAAQSKMKDESKAAKEQQNAAKQNTEIINIKSTVSWGEKFKPESGSWECQNCLIRNQSDIQICSACNNPREGTTSVNPLNKTTFGNPTRFNFGIPIQSVGSVEPTKSLPISTTSSWGDKFKAKEGTWECKCCFIRNESNLEYCNACNSPKDPNLKKDSKSILGTDAPTVQFRFGYPPVSLNQQNLAESSSSIFDGTGTHKFKFGVPKRTSDNLKSSDHIEDQINEELSSNLENIGPINFSIKNSYNSTNNKTDVQLRTTLLPTPQTDFAIKQPAKEGYGNFGFVFAPKSLVKNVTEKDSKEQSEHSDTNRGANEGDSCISSTSIRSPESSAEKETSIFSQTAKLYRFVNGKWKKRGDGKLNIMKLDEAKKYRILMQNEQSMKVCLNHTLTPEITYTPKDGQSWLFAVSDLSDGDSSLQQFCLTFTNKDTALQFKDVVDKAREGNFDSEIEAMKYNLERDTKKQINDDVVFVREINATKEEQDKAKELMLPENYFTYKNKEPCHGCRGCDREETNIITPVKATSELPLGTNSATNNLSFSLISSPTSSIYGTPSNYEKTFNTPMFQTSFNTIDSTNISATPTLPKFGSANIFTQRSSDVTKRENNAGNKKTSDMGLLNDQIQSKSIFASGDTTTYAQTTLPSVLASPKLSTVNTSSTKTITDNRASANNTGFGDIKLVFGNTSLGTSTNKSIFFNPPPTENVDNPKEVKSVFGEKKQNTDNICSRSNPGSIFGNNFASESDSKTKINFEFGPQQSLSGSNNSMFENVVIKNLGSDFKNDKDIKNVSNSNDTAELKDITNDSVNIFDSDLSFANLCPSIDGASFKKKPDFKWADAGQQLFSLAQKSLKSQNKDEVDNDASGASRADEEYDPHYEPLVPLPDKIVVTTGEENEQKLFSERCKLYRYDENTREWKERGVGEIKILYHPDRKTYRLLLRREQIHKLVLNMMLFNEFEMLPMMKSDRAWTWAGINFSENPAGEQETLAVRFKSTELANKFFEKVVASVKMVQALSITSTADEKDAVTDIKNIVADVEDADENKFTVVPPLRLPKHMADSASADPVSVTRTESVTQATSSVLNDQEIESKTEDKPIDGADVIPEVDQFKQVQFQVPEEEDYHGEEDYEYDQNYYDNYYNEEEEDEDESGAFYTCDGEAVIEQGATVTKCEHAHILVAFDQEICSPKILVTDSVTGEILTDMLIHTDTNFEMSGDKCKWSGQDFTSNDPVDKTVTVSFYDSESAMRFYDSCETSKAATYSSTDPES